VRMGNGHVGTQASSHRSRSLRPSPSASLGPGPLRAAGWGWAGSRDPGVLSRACAATWAQPGASCGRLGARSPASPRTVRGRRGRGDSAPWGPAGELAALGTPVLPCCSGDTHFPLSFPDIREAGSLALARAGNKFRNFQTPLAFPNANFPPLVDITISCLSLSVYFNHTQHFNDRFPIDELMVLKKKKIEIACGF
jgi:hypothetical protein